MIRKYFGIATRQIHVFSREAIKPSSPTASHLKHYNLSSMDQVMFRNYIPIVLFFPNNDYDSPMKSAEKSRKLKHSLSKTLAKYYPFAGRLTCGQYVDCNDKGVEFQEARIKSRLSVILEKDNDVASDLVYPVGLAEGGFDNDSSLMVVKLSHFDCGGIAIAVCLSHRVADAYTLSTFLTYWAAVTRQTSEQVLPHVILSPPNDPVTMQEIPPPKKNWVTRKFVFQNTKIAQLKSMVALFGVQNPTRFEVLAALLYRCAMTAAKSSSGISSPSILLYAMNMRTKMVPQLPKTSVGNFMWHVRIPTTTENGSNLNVLTDQIKKGKMQVGGLKVLDGEELMSMILFAQNNYKMYFCSSLCNFDMYKVDFGWGNPVRVTLSDPLFNNSIIFTDTPSGDGIEAQVSLDEQEMVAFELDKELVAFASLH
ncbi:hypothetical protein LguiA_022268 [Lonicera macranthoides]